MIENLKKCDTEMFKNSVQKCKEKVSDCANGGSENSTEKYKKNSIEKYKK